MAVLAAGRGSRFGGAKLEAICAGKPLGRWALDAVEDAGLGSGMIVTGPAGASFAEGWRPVVNPEPDAGIGSSLALAARIALEGDADGLLVLLADMPLVTSAYLRELVGYPPPVVTRYPQWFYGVPAVLSRSLMEEATHLQGNRGAQALLAAVHAPHFLEPPMEILFDVDTPEDLAEAERRLRSRSQ